ncbi:P27 family phage terminase small subunit (plasmid) [Komagataeibacter medellinensis]|uniref:P27 family phage terminase small subunit n=1 Tax=Komagataeibacter medellinensis TaxID=1177712 RepID=A0ABQ6VTW2_9PROT|nr:P27 family phage terminase small subunit [Komagataeibacter medellinensis]KAB8122208.1 P27 family phage terminase small subunit [Komagataeibacter medellinensis]
MTKEEYKQQLIKILGSKDSQFCLALDQFSQLLQDRDELQKLVDTQGFTYQAGDLWKPNPAQGQLRETQKQILTFYSRFGLTPRDKQLLMRESQVDAEDGDFSEYSDLQD